MVSFFERFTCSEILQKFLVHDTEYLRNTVTFDSTYVLCGYVYIFHIELFQNSIAVNLLDLFYRDNSNLNESTDNIIFIYSKLILLN